MIDCETARDLAVARVTGDIDGEEARALLEHVALCPACSAYLRDTTTTLHVMGYGVPPVAPPPALRERVLEAVRREARRDAMGPDARLRTRRPLGRVWPAVARVAGVAALVWLGILTALAWRGENAVRDVAGRFEAVREELRAAATVLGEAKPEPVQMVALSPSAGFTKDAWGRATVYRTGYGYVLVLALGGMEPLPPGQVYRLWLVRDGQREDAGEFRPDEHRYAMLMVHRPGLDFDALGISREPDASPVAAPRGPRVMAGELGVEHDPSRPGTW